MLATVMTQRITQKPKKNKGHSQVIKIAATPARHSYHTLLTRKERSGKQDCHGVMRNIKYNGTQ